MTYFDYNDRECNKEANILANLAEWKPKKQPFYLELHGETSALVDEAYAEVVPAGGTDPRATGRRQCTNIDGRLTGSLSVSFIPGVSRDYRQK